ncbi:unnamed protein product [Paramecium primaurelia]|uniref:PH domain-containing protein n=1 Tax=Paramecium primaurelia TaxID=5886 RepID=A0A8S1NB07_PARPR|nr:unnamed protein product [Paramecium primaurelia]
MDTHKYVKAGEVFVKHHKFGVEKIRLIYILDDILYWTKPEDFNKQKPKGKIKLEDILQIENGLKKAKKLKDLERASNCFSIITKERTLELEASNIQIKNLWTNIINNILKQYSTPQQ